MDKNTWDMLSEELSEARNSDNPSERLVHLRSVRDYADELLNNTMAEAVVYSGASLSAVARAAGFGSDNTARARLAESDLFSSYASGGQISAAEVHRARHDYGATPKKDAPMRFVPRKPTKGS